jgi:arylsulfatase A-like enzyme
VRFGAAQSVFTETGPAHASLLSGLLPHQHGVTANVVKFNYEGRVPTALYKAGYQTAAFVSAVPVRAKYGFNVGFEHFDDELDPKYRKINMQRGGPLTIDRTLEWLERKRDPKRPLFLWVHLFDPHADYDPPDLPPGETIVTRKELDKFLALKGPIPESDKQRVRDMYRRELQHVDKLIRRLFEGYPQQSDRGVIWSLVADHGEALFDHSNFCEHNRALYQSVLHVPLMIRWDGFLTAREVDIPVNSTALATTLLMLADVELMPNMVEALPLDGRPPDEEPVIVSHRAPNGKYFGGRASAVRRGRYKAIFYEQAHRKQPALFDLGSDPNERRNLASARPEMLASMEKALTAHAPKLLDPKKIGKIDDDVKRAMEQMGYFDGDDEGADEGADAGDQGANGDNGKKRGERDDKSP